MDWLKCFQCEKEVEENENHITINIHLERFEEGAISVVSADCVKVYCQKCSDLYNFNKIIVPFKNETTN